MTDAGPRPPQVTSLDSIRCSFCGKRGTEVDAIVAGPAPSIAICNECVGLCTEIVAEQRPPPAGPDPAAA